MKEGDEHAAGCRVDCGRIASCYDRACSCATRDFSIDSEACIAYSPPRVLTLRTGEAAAQAAEQQSSSLISP